MFGLRDDVKMRWTLQQHDLYDPPNTLSKPYSFSPMRFKAYIDYSKAAILSEIDFVVSGSPKNEASARCILNNILVCCVAEEKKLARSTAQTGSSTASIGPTLRPTTPTPEPAELSLRFETELKCVVTYKREARTLSGLADYTLWYDNTESMGTNLVVVEAKRLQAIEEAAAQLVAYMGKFVLVKYHSQMLMFRSDCTRN